MKTAYNKVWRDLVRNKGRTLLVVLSIAVGVMAVGMIMASNTLMTRQLAVSNAAANPSHGRISLNGIIDEDTLFNLENLPGVVAADGRLGTGIQWKSGLEGAWEDGNLRALTDYENQKFDYIELRQGIWPSRDGVIVAYNQLEGFGVPGLGETLFLQVNDRTRAYQVVGIYRDPNVLVPPFEENPTFYITKDLFRDITGFDRFGQVRITTPAYSEAAVQAAADQIDRTLNRLGIEVSFVDPTDPADHWAQSIMDGVGLILAIMAVASLGLSTFLIVNTMNALMMQQVPQIGMMKTVGGLSRQITLIYLTGVAVYGLLALLVAVPTGAIAGDALTRWMLTFINVPPGPFELVQRSLVIQIVTGLLAPLLAGLYPVLRGVAIPVARAISSYGLGQGHYGARLIDRIVSRLRGLPRLATLALRNTFRRPVRVAMMQITLIVAGAVFMMVLTTQQSFNFTIDRIFEGFGFDVLLIFEQQQRIEEIESLARAHPDVAVAEMWIFDGGLATNPSDPSLGTLEVELRGVPRETRLFTPQLVAGRNLDPMDGHAVLFNQKLAAELGLGLGDTVVLEFNGFEDSNWTIVGLILDLGANAGQRSVYVHREVLNIELNQSGRARVLEIQGWADNLDLHKSIEESLTAEFEAEGMGVSYSITSLENKELANAQFSVLTTILLIMTVVIAAVGGIGLSGTLSINVIERTREIGVMRAVGASSTDIGRIFMGEGLFLGVISWALAIPLSALAGERFVLALGEIIDFPFEYMYSSRSVLIWLGIVVVLSLAASWLPSRRATRISVRESLAYE